MSFLIERLRDFGLTHSEILDILNDPPISCDGPVKAGRKDYANIPGADLRKLSEMFWQSVGPPPDEARSTLACYELGQETKGKSINENKRRADEADKGRSRYSIEWNALSVKKARHQRF